MLQINLVLASRVCCFGFSWLIWCSTPADSVMPIFEDCLGSLEPSSERFTAFPFERWFLNLAESHPRVFFFFFPSDSMLHASSVPATSLPSSSSKRRISRNGNHVLAKIDLQGSYHFYPANGKCNRFAAQQLSILDYPTLWCRLAHFFLARILQCLLDSKFVTLLRLRNFVPFRRRENVVSCSDSALRPRIFIRVCHTRARDEKGVRHVIDSG